MRFTAIALFVAVFLATALACTGCEGGGLSNAWWNAYLDTTAVG